MGEISDRPGNDSGRRTPRGLLALLVLVVALLASATAGSAMTASPADPATGVSTLAASGGLPKEVKYLCAAKKGGVLRYVTGPKRCSGKEVSIKISSDRPIAACASESSGIVRRIPLSGKCRSGEDRMALPGKEPRRFCAAAGKGRLIYDPNSPCEPEDTPVVVPAANKAPSARAAAVTVDEDASVDATLRATDPDGDRLTYSIENDPNHGEVTGGDTDRTYTPDPDFNGNDAFVFRVSDGKGGTDTAKVNVSVTPINDAPVAENDTKFTPENTPLSFPASDLLSNDSKGAPNENGQNLTVTSVSNAQNGAVDLDEKGNSDPSDDEVTFTPQTNYKGPASFEYEVCDDGSPQLCSAQTATVNVAVTPVNSKPVATDGTASMDEDDAPITIDLAALVSDAETADADLTYTITDGPSASEGELTGSGSTRTFDSADDFNGTVEVLYKVTDRGDPDDCGAPGPDCAEAKDSDVAKVTVTVDPVNDAPVSTADDYEVDEDGTLNVADGPDDVLANDTDVDNDPLTAVLVSGPSHEASFTLNGDGSFDYAPDADYGGDDSFSYKANDGTTDGNTVTVSIAVRPVNDNPDAKDDTVTTDEDVDAVVDVLANDVFAPDTGETLSVQSVSTPSHGVASKVATGPDAGKILYEPEAEYSGPDSFDYTIEDGNGGTDTATVNVTVDPVNDAPVVTTSNGSASYTEGQTGPDDTIVDPDLTLSDVEDTSLDGAAVEITSNFASGKDNMLFTNTANISGSYNDTTGVLTLVGNAPLDEYRNALRSVRFESTGDDPGSATRTVRFTADDGAASNNTGSATRDVDVTPVNDAPTNTVPSGPLTVAQDKDTSITGSSVADPDAGSSAVEVTLDVDHGEITLKDDVSGGLTGGNLDGSGSGTVTITGTLAKINATLADPDGLVYHSFAAFTGEDKLTMTTDDRGNTGTGGNETDTDTLDLDVKKINDAPIPTDDDRMTAEDDTLRFLASTLTANDSPGVGEAGQTMTVTAVNATSNTHGTVSLDDKANADPSDDEVVYVPEADYNGPASFQYTVQDDGGTANGGQDTATGTVNVTITAVNDAPVAADDSRTTDEDTDLVVAASDLATNDDKGPVSATDETSQNLTVTAVGNASGGSVGLSNGQITFDPNNDFNGLASFEYTVRDDGQTDGSDDFKTDTGTVHVTVTAVNDAPVLSVPATIDVDEDVTTALTGISASDVDAGAGSVTLKLSVPSGTVSATSGSGVTVGGSSSARTLTGTVANINAFIAATNVSFTTAQDADADVTLTVEVDDNGNTGSGDAKTDSETVTIDVIPVNDAPVADDETFNGANGAIGNTSLIVNDPDDGAPNESGPKKTITGDILAGDTDVDGPGPLTVTPGTFATNGGGSVTIQEDGDFTFHPAAATSCTNTSDFFDYSLEDSGSPEQTDTGRVTISIAGCVWYVSNNAAGNSGTSQAPFDTLAQAETASGANHTVFVYEGDNTTTGYDAGGYQMNAGERLIGEHEGLTVDPDQGGALTADALHPANIGAHPTFTATNADVIDLDDGNELRGFNVDPGGTGGGIFGGSGDTGGGTIDDVNIIDNGTAAQQAGLELNGTTGTFNVTSFVVANKAHGVLLNNAGTVDFGGDSSQISLSTQGGPAFTATATNMNTSQIDDITVTNSTNGAVDMDTTTGTTILGDGTGTDLNLTTASGAEPALDLNNAGTLAVGSGGTDELHAAGGPALDVTSTSGPSLNFDDVDSTNSASDGINLDGLGTGTFTATSGDIGGYSGIGFDLNGGAGTVTYPGNFNNASGSLAVDITGRTSGANSAVTLSGPFNDTSDDGGGINVGSNSGGTTTFSNATSVFNTGTSDAVLFNNSDGHTLTLSGGGLDIDTTSGKGLEAATSGTLNVTGSGNTINTTTGSALNVSNTDIGSSNLTFQSISAGTTAAGPTNAIGLTNTGSGGLTVSGVGTTDGSGGTIRRTSGDAAQLTNASNVTFKNMDFLGTATTDGSACDNVTNAGCNAAIDVRDVTGLSLDNVTIDGTGEGGINGTNVTGFSLANSLVTNTGNGEREHSLRFTTLLGDSSITNSTITNSAERNMQLDNSSGSLDLTITDSVFRDSGRFAPTFPGDGLLFIAAGSAQADLVISDTDFINHDAKAVQILSQGASSVVNTRIDDGTRFQENYQGLELATSNAGRMTFLVQGNSFTKHTFDGLPASNNMTIFSIGSSRMEGRVTGNTINSTLSSTQDAGVGIRVNNNETSNARVRIDSNNISVPIGPAIEMQSRSANDQTLVGRLDVLVTGNTATTAGGSAAFDALFWRVQHLHTMCAQISGNTATEPGGSSDGIDVQKGSTATFQIQGYNGDGSTTSVESYLAGQNPATDTVNALGTGFVGGTCNAPDLTPLNLAP